MLNAFRHQRKKRELVARDGGPKLGCSTPSGIKGRNAGNGEKKMITVRKCSTPSGIKGRNADSQAAEMLSERDMLNAFRHQRKKRKSYSERLKRLHENAQRLPASKEETPQAAARLALDRRCSTPSGIKGRNASSPRRASSGCS